MRISPAITLSVLLLGGVGHGEDISVDGTVAVNKTLTDRKSVV